ncbi:DUF1616 domain-containing protein [Natrinema sp. 74]|uniref:DUF1616 domain-containing protein n=1 Tax=Natrinema sp. 74 TaxID=3384159 RepID=UPI0038D44979
MAVFSSLWRLLPRSIRTMPADLVAVVVVVLATDLAVVTPVLKETAIRVPLGLAFVLVAPGYAFVAALFPERGAQFGRNGTTTDDADGPATGIRRSLPLDDPITDVERIVLTVASSVAITPLLGLAIHFSPVSVRLQSIAVVLTGTTVALTAVATYRRRSVSPEARFRAPYRQWLASTRERVLDADSRAETTLTLLLATTLVLSVGGVGYAVTYSQTGETFTEVAIQTDDGERVTDSYSSSVGADGRDLVITLENREQRSISYSVVVVEQRIASDGTAINATVREQNELRRFETRLAHGESWSRSHDVEPTLTGDSVRIAWLVYADGSVPPTPSLENADYSTHLWVNTSTG